jgi:16S rRNA (guanine527-N7)-methyltransferase
MKDINWFQSICAVNGLPLSAEQADQFENYRRLLLEANKQLNLISRKDEENFYPNHALNSISFLFGLKLKPDAWMLDLGTGGGLPGVPILILNKGIRMRLLDSIGKKTAALQAILHEMKFESAEVITGRAEDLSKRSEFQGRFDYVISRAAGKLDEVAKWSHGFLGSFQAAADDFIPAGTLIVLKGGEFENEIKHARNLKFVRSVTVTETAFQGMDEIYNKEKKLVMINYSAATRQSRGPAGSRN